MSSLFRFCKANHRSLLCSSLSNGLRTSPSLSYYGCPLSSELRKYWLVALRRDEGANSRVSESTVLCSERFLRKIFTFLLVPKSPWTLPVPIMAKQATASRFLKADAMPSELCHRCFFFSSPVSHGMSVRPAALGNHCSRRRLPHANLQPALAFAEARLVY